MITGLVAGTLVGAASGVAKAHDAVDGTAHCSVTVNLDVLEQLGPPSGLAAGSSALAATPERRIVLRPPDSMPPTPRRAAAAQPAPADQTLAPATLPPPAIPRRLSRTAAPAAAGPALAEPAARAVPENRLAALPRIALPAGGGHALTVRFARRSSALDPDAAGLLAALADEMARSDGRLQLNAFAGGSGGNAASAARRLSLSRALAVRAYLIQKGVRSTRIDVRALGVPDDGGSPERVDVLLLVR